MPSKPISFLLTKLKIKENNPNQQDEDVVSALLKRSDSHNVLMTTYKSLIKHEELLNVWNDLLEHGIKINENAHHEKPLLIELISYGYNVDVFVNALESVLKLHREWVNETDTNGQTPLMAAAENGNEKVVNLLLQYGADRNAKNKDNKTAADIALDKQQNSTVEEATEQYAKVYQLVKRK